MSKTPQKKSEYEYTQSIILGITPVLFARTTYSRHEVEALKREAGSGKRKRVLPFNFKHVEVRRETFWLEIFISSKVSTICDFKCVVEFRVLAF